MNRIRHGLIFFCTTLVLLALAACASHTPQEKVSQALGVDASAGEVITDSDTHGGFNGDGLEYIVLFFSDGNLLKEAETSDAWHPLPLNDNLTALVYGLTYEEEEGVLVSIGPYLSDGSGEPLIPEIQNGYVFFQDRHSQSTDPQDDSRVLERGSFNFTLAIYDSDTGTLYFCQLDT